MVTFTAHLSVTIKRLTGYKQKLVLAAMLEGNSMTSNMAAKTNHNTLLKNQSAIKYLSKVRILSNFGCKIHFMCSVNFWHHQDSNSLFKGSIGHLLVQVAYVYVFRLVCSRDAAGWLVGFFGEEKSHILPLKKVKIC